MGTLINHISLVEHMFRIGTPQDDTCPPCNEESQPTGDFPLVCPSMNTSTIFEGFGFSQIHSQSQKTLQYCDICQFRGENMIKIFKIKIYYAVAISLCVGHSAIYYLLFSLSCFFFQIIHIHTPLRISLKQHDNIHHIDFICSLRIPEICILILGS